MSVEWDQSQWLGPLPPPTCPARGWHPDGATTVTSDGPDTWRCSCGCRFVWTSPFHWWVLEPPTAGLPNYPPART